MTPFNRACGFPAHGFPESSEGTALRSLRVPNCPAQAVETEGVKEGWRPSSGLTRSQVAAVALDGAPATQSRVQLRDGLAQVPMTGAARGTRLHALANPARQHASVIEAKEMAR